MNIFETSALRKAAVNWVDGMKLSEQHFNQMQDHVLDLHRDALLQQVTPFRYGLLPPTHDWSKSLDYSIRIDQGKIIQIQVLQCRAITPSGMRIEILRSGAETLYAAADLLQAEFPAPDVSSDAYYSVVIAVNPYLRKPVGEPDPEESPARMPFALPQYKIELVPSKQIKDWQGSKHFIEIARIILDQKELKTDDTFIPPCFSVQNHPELYNRYLELGNTMGELGSLATSIVQKVRSEKTKTSLGANVEYVSENILHHLSFHIVRFRWNVPMEAPVHMMEPFVSLAYVLRNSLDCLPEKDREEILTYFQQWSEVSPADFENRIRAVMSVQPNQGNMAESLAPILILNEILLKLFRKLSKLKFIGEQPDSGIVLGETVEQKKPEKKSGWSFLTD